MKTELRNSKKEHNFLQDKLKLLQRHQKKMRPRAKVRISPWKKNLFERKSKDIKSVTHRIDYEPHRDKQFEKTTNLLQKQADIELDACTFNPQLNQKSLKMASKKDHIMGREVPNKYRRSVIDEKKRILELERQEEEVAQLRIPDYSGRQPDEKFFEKTVQWKKNAIEKSSKVKDKNYAGETVGMKNVPSINQNSSKMAERIFDGKAFLERVPKNLEDKKLLKQKLELKYYNYPYKPKILHPEKEKTKEEKEESE